MTENPQHIIYGGPEPELVNVNFDSLGDYILDVLAQNSDIIGVIDGITSQELTYGQLRDQSIELAKCMKEAGLQKGDTVGLCSENRLEFPVPFLASIYLGATVAPLNLTYTERELHHALNLSHPKFIFASPYGIDKVAAVAKQNSFVKKVILFGDEELEPGVILYSKFLETYSKKTTEVFKSTPVKIKEQNALILCSSGTTGLPKGVQLTQFNLLSAIGLFTNGITEYSVASKDVIILGVIPWFHAFGCLTLIGVCCAGVRIVCLPKFEEGLFLSCIENYRCNVIFMVPPLMVFLAKHPLVDNYDLSSLQELLCGAAPLSKETEDAVYARIGVKHIRQGYGMSETTLSVLVQRDDLRKSGSVGTISTGTWAKVIDPETGNTLGPNKPGELCFKGNQIMKGYIGNEQATRDTIDKDGWLHTGDVGYYDDDKHFFIVDRLKELIKYKAYQVPPAEIESVLLTNPKVKDAAVIGIPNEEAGELPMAFVVKQPDANISEKEIIKYVEDRVSAAKRLRGGVRFIDEIPKNISGKILRRDLRDLLKSPKAKL